MILVNIRTMKNDSFHDHIFSAAALRVVECSENGVPLAIEIVSQEGQGCWNYISYDLPSPSHKNVYVMNQDGKTFQSYHFHKDDSKEAA